MFLSELKQRILEGDLAVFGALAMLVFAIVVMVERIYSMYFKYSVKGETFMSQIKTLILADKIEEAINLCAAQGSALVPQVVKMVLQRSDRDDSSIRAGFDLGCQETVPQVTKRLGYLAMVSNVATLLGLLGTIHGLIQSFQAVSFADPVQKQALLAQGISTAMNMTLLGLAIAIPTMVVYAFLQARQGKLLEDIISSGSIVADMLMSRNYQSFDEDVAYPAGGNGKAPTSAPPAPPKRKAG